MVGKIGQVSIVIAVAACCFWTIPAMFLCIPAAFTVSARESYLCPGIKNVAQYLILISVFFTGVFLLDLLCDDSSAQEREIRRQIELEKQKSRKQDDDEPREWIMK